MTAIGRALMSRPRLLVLDEPSMGLAPLVGRGHLRTLMRLNREEGLSILVAEQNSAVALQLRRPRDRAGERRHRPRPATADELRQRDDIKAFYLGVGAETPARLPVAA